MKRLLRSVIDFGDIPHEQLAHNLQRLNSSHIDWSLPSDQKIYDFILQHFQQNLELPSAQTVKDYFERIDDLEVLERVKDIEAAPAYVRSNFLHLLKNTVEEQNRIKALAVLKEGQEILGKGLIIDKERLLGVKAALHHVSSRLSEMIVPDNDSKTHGEIRMDGQQVWDEYMLSKMSKDKAWGKFTGLNEIDKVCKGIKKGELWVHAAFTGELKSTLALNWAYNLITRYRTNVFYVSLEMPYEQVRRIMYCIHSTHPRWREMGYEKPLEYSKIRDGELTPEEEEFYKLVIADFSTNPEYCRFEVFAPDRDVTIQDIKLEAEMVHRKMEIGLTIIDHGGNVEARKSKRRTSTSEEANSVIRDAKMFALHFNGREGMAVLLLYQINRQGKEDADKNDGVYKLKALSYANECLIGGTLVKSDRGLVPVEHLTTDDRVWSSTGWRQVLDTFDQGVRDTFEVRTQNGIRVTATENHRFRVLERDGNVRWLEVGQLIPGQHYVLGDFSSRPFPETAPNLPSLEFEQGHKPNGKHGDLPTLRVPTTITKELAYLMGAYEGDGILGNDDFLGFTGNRKEVSVRERISRHFKDTFGHPLTRSECPSRIGSFDLRKFSRPLKQWALSVGMDRKPGVPSVILQAPRECVVAYLQGFWDTDGSINSQNIISLGQRSGNRKTLEDVQMLMTDLGIETTLEDGVCKVGGKSHPRTILRIRTQEGRKRFAEMIGFTEPWKKERLERSLRVRSVTKSTWPLGSIYLEVFEAYAKKGRMVSDSMVRFPRQCVITAKRLRKGEIKDVPEGSLRLLVDTLRDKDDLRVQHLQWLLESTRPYLVTSVTPQGPQQVYDIEVTGNHEYATGGLLSHNCERSADYVTTTYLNDEYRRAGHTKICNLKNRDNAPFAPFLAAVNFASRRIYNMDIYNGATGMGMTLENDDEIMEAMSNL